MSETDIALRDFFAAHAMAALIGAGSALPVTAEDAYWHADRMMEEKARTEKERKEE